MIVFVFFLFLLFCKKKKKISNSNISMCLSLKYLLNTIFFTLVIRDVRKYQYADYFSISAYCVDVQK